MRTDATRNADDPTLFDVQQTAHRLGVTVRWVRRAIAERRIPFVKIGHHVRFDPDELEVYIDERRIEIGTVQDRDHQRSQAGGILRIVSEHPRERA